MFYSAHSYKNHVESRTRECSYTHTHIYIFLYVYSGRYSADNIISFVSIVDFELGWSLFKSRSNSPIIYIRRYEIRRAFVTQPLNDNILDRPQT